MFCLLFVSPSPGPSPVASWKDIGSTDITPFGRSLRGEIETSFFHHPNGGHLSYLAPFSGSRKKHPKQVTTGRSWYNISKIRLEQWWNHGCLRYRGDYTTQLWGDCNKGSLWNNQHFMESKAGLVSVVAKNWLCRRNFSVTVSSWRPKYSGISFLGTLPYAAEKWPCLEVPVPWSPYIRRCSVDAYPEVAVGEVPNESWPSKNKQPGDSMTFSSPFKRVTNYHPKKVTKELWDFWSFATFLLENVTPKSKIDNQVQVFEQMLFSKSCQKGCCVKLRNAEIFGLIFQL